MGADGNWQIRNILLGLMVLSPCKRRAIWNCPGTGEAGQRTPRGRIRAVLYVLPRHRGPSLPAPSGTANALVAVYLHDPPHPEPFGSLLQRCGWFSTAWPLSALETRRIPA